MSTADDIAACMADAFSDAGESATYTPVDASVAPFECTVLSGSRSMVEWEFLGIARRENYLIRHSELSTQGISAPTEQSAGRGGDKITVTNSNGDSETWEIVGKPEEIRSLAAWRVAVEKT